MKTFKFHTVTPLFTEDLDFVVDNVRRVRRETGLNCIAFSLSMHPQGTPAAARAAKTIDAFRKVKQALVAILDALCGGRMPLLVDEGQDVSARLGRMRDGAALLAVFNANLDPLEGVRLRSTAPIAAVKRLESDGAWHDLPFAAEGDGRYRLDVRLEIAVPGIFKLL